LTPNLFNSYRYAGGAEVCQDLSDGTTYMELWNGSSGNKSGAGVYITNTGEGANFIGLNVDTVKVWLKKSAGAPDNSFSVGIYRTSAPDTEIYNFHNGSLDDITESMVQYEFTSTSGSKHTIATGDVIAVIYEYNGSRLYSNIESSTISGLAYKLYNEWDQYSSWNIWSGGSGAGITFCVS